MNKTVAVALGLALASAGALAGPSDPITPTFGSFGALPGASFSGTGIPNANVAITTFSQPLVSLSALTLGLTATQRCDSTSGSQVCGTPLTNDGAGTFTAQSGAPFLSSLPVALPTYASWNIGFYAAGNTNLYAFKLLYDFNPAVGNAESTHGEAKLFTLGGNPGSSGLHQGSVNSGFGFLTTGVPGAVSPPAFTFDPNVNGEYSFALTASDKISGLELARTAIVVSSVPEPESYVLGLAGLVGLAFVSRRRSSAS